MLIDTVGVRRNRERRAGWKPAARQLRLCRFNLVVGCAFGRTVIGNVRLGRFTGVVVCKLCVTVCEMSMVRGGLRVSAFVLLGCVFMVSRGVLVVLCGLHVMFCGLL
jgi:hypothetical protein